MSKKPTFAGYLKFAMGIDGITQMDLEEHLLKDQSQVSKLINLKSKNIDDYESLARRLNIPEIYYIGLGVKMADVFGLQYKV